MNKAVYRLKSATKCRETQSHWLLRLISRFHAISRQRSREVDLIGPWTDRGIICMIVFRLCFLDPVRVRSQIRVTKDKQVDSMSTSMLLLCQNANITINYDSSTFSYLLALLNSTALKRKKKKSATITTKRYCPTVHAKHGVFAFLLCMLATLPALLVCCRTGGITAENQFTRRSCFVLY